MILVDQFMDIKVRHGNGQSIRSIAEDLGVARNTVRKVLRKEHSIEATAPSTKRRPKRSKLDPYRAFIRERVQEFNLSPIRLLAEIQPMGYRGGVHTIRRFVQSLSQDKVRIELATVRFETPPGKQAQCDWAHVGKFPGSQGKMIDIYVFVIVLGYSRQMYIEFTTDMKIPTLIACHQRAFEFFQGIPQAILYDNMSQVRSNPGRLNLRFLDFANHYGFTVKTHRPYRPRTKGKVERAVDYIKDNFLNGRRFEGLSDMQMQAFVWLEQTANVRVHGTTGEKPQDLWLQEKEQLLDLSQVKPFQLAVREERKVASDSFVSYGRSRYSVPPCFIGKNVEVSAELGVIRIYTQDAIIAEHQEAQHPGQTIMEPVHMEELWRETLEMIPVRGKPHCEVNLQNEVVERRELSIYEEVVQ